MTGQIPKYGEHFRITNREYDRVLGNRRYTLKADARFYIQSDKASKRWHTFGPDGEFGEPQPSLTTAMPVVVARHASAVTP